MDLQVDTQIEMQTGERQPGGTYERLKEPEASKEDLLLKQIDEFRERAAQLRSMLDTRESQAEELKSIVDERQEKADKLDQILKERQKKADGFTAVVEEQMDSLIARVDTKIDRFGSSIKGEIDESGRIAREQRRELKTSLDYILSGSQKNADALTSEVERQIDALIARVGAKMDEIESAVTGGLGDSNRISREQAQQMRDMLSQIQEQLQQAKGELSDKVHTENVKVYRNLQDSFKSMEEKLEQVGQLENRLKSTKTSVNLAMIFSIFDLLLLVLLLLVNLGFFAF